MSNMEIYKNTINLALVTKENTMLLQELQAILYPFLGNKQYNISEEDRKKVTVAFNNLCEGVNEQGECIKNLESSVNEAVSLNMHLERKLKYMETSAVEQPNASDVNEEIKKLTTNNKLLRSAVRKHKENCEKLTIQLHETERKVEEDKQHIEALTNENHTLRRNCSCLQKQLNAQDTEVKSHQNVEQKMSSRECLSMPYTYKELCDLYGESLANSLQMLAIVYDFM